MVAAVADVVIPACAAVGIAFALWQWFLVSKVKVSAYAASGNGAVFQAHDEDEDVGMGGGHDEEEEGDGVAAVARCAEIQSAISVGEYRFKLILVISLRLIWLRWSCSWCGVILPCTKCKLIAPLCFFRIRARLTSMNNSANHFNKPILLLPNTEESAILVDIRCTIYGRHFSFSFSTRYQDHTCSPPDQFIL